MKNFLLALGLLAGTAQAIPVYRCELSAKSNVLDSGALGKTIALDWDKQKIFKDGQEVFLKYGIFYYRSGPEAATYLKSGEYTLRYEFKFRERKNTADMTVFVLDSEDENYTLDGVTKVDGTYNCKHDQ